MVVGVGGGRDWRAYGRFRRDEEALFLSRARTIVWGMPPPWESRGGRPPSHDPRALVVCLLLMRELRKDYRGMESHLRARRGLLDTLGLRKAPGKSTLHRAATRLSERYMRMVNERLVEPFKGGAWPPTQRASEQGVTRRG